MNFNRSKWLFVGLVLNLFVSAVAGPVSIFTSLQEASTAFSTNSPIGKKQIYQQMETYIKNIQRPIPLHDAIVLLRRMATTENMVDRYDAFCFSNAVSCTNEVLREQFLNGFARSPGADAAPQNFVDKIDGMLSNLQSPSIGFCFAAAKAKADIFTSKMKDADRGVSVLESFMEEAGTNEWIRISTQVKLLEIHRTAQNYSAVESTAFRLYTMESCPDFAFTAAALALSDCHVRRRDISKAGHYLIDVLEKSVSVPVGFAYRFTKIKAEEKSVESAIKLIRNRIAKVSLYDSKTFRAAVERWHPELIVLLTYLGRGEEALGECRVLMFFSSELKYRKAVELTAKTFKIVDGNIGRASAFMNFQKKGIVPKQLNVMMEPARLCDDVRSEYRKSLSVLQDDRWEDLLVLSQRFLWLDDPYASVECALKAFSLAPFNAKSLQACADAVMKPVLSVTRDPLAAKTIVDYLMYGQRGKDGIKDSTDDVANPLETWGDRLRTDVKP